MVSTIFVDTIKASVATLLDMVIGEYIRENCSGCEINHPRQRRHPCLYHPSRYYFFNHFEALLKRFVPSIPRVYGVTKAFQHELYEAIYIHEKLKEI